MARDQQDARAGPNLAHAPAERDTAHPARHHDAAEDEIEVAARLDRGERLGAVAGGDDLVAATAQEPRRDVANVVALYQEDRSLRRARGSARSRGVSTGRIGRS